MTRADALRAEFEHETQVTRKQLERLPAGAFDWRPHPKSSTAGQLAAHLVECVGWAAPVFGADELDFDPKTYAFVDAKSVAALLAAFDAAVSRGMQAMVGTADPDATQPWRLKILGKVRFERPRETVFRDMALSHLVHHRGQFSVYLRLLDVPVPGSYGPTADEG